MIETPIEAEAKRNPRRAGARRRRHSGGVPRRGAEVYVVPDGMVDVALRELGAKLVIDDSEPTQYRSAA